MVTVFCSAEHPARCAAGCTATLYLAAQLLAPLAVPCSLLLARGYHHRSAAGDAQHLRIQRPASALPAQLGSEERSACTRAIQRLVEVGTSQQARRMATAQPAAMQVLAGPPGADLRPWGFVTAAQPTAIH